MRKSTQLSFSVSGSGNKPLVPMPPLQPIDNPGSGNIPGDLARSLAEAAGRGAVNAAAEHFRNRGKRKSKSNPNPDSSRRGGGGKNNNDQASAGGRRGGISPAIAERRAVSVNWNSGIKSGLVVNPLQEASSVFTPLFVLNGQFFPKLKESADSNMDFNYSDAVLKDFVFADYLQTLFDQHYKAGQSTSIRKFTSYFDTIIEGLQLYYMIDSIITYCSVNKNQNVGMMQLRRNISVDIIYYHEQLGERLSAMFIPNNLLLYIRYMYQNFSFGNTIDAPIVRLGFRNYLQDQNSGVSNYELTPSVYLNVLRRLQQGFDLSSSLLKWKRDNASEALSTHLPASSAEIYYDPQFCTFWHNCNIAYRQGTEVKYTRAVVDESTNLYYGSYAEEVDGSIFASCSITLISVEDDETLSSDGEYFKSERVLKQETGIWEPHSDFGQGTANSECSSLCVYYNGRITALTTVGHRIASQNYSAPVFQNGNWTEVDGSSAGAKHILQHTIKGTQSAVGETINLLFRV